jgi:hypothetical protein
MSNEKGEIREILVLFEDDDFVLYYNNIKKKIPKKDFADWIINEQPKVIKYHGIARNNKKTEI